MRGEPQGRAEIKRLLEKHGVRPRRSLGQHFLADPNLVRKIVRLAAIEPGMPVLEVGAGTGTLTRALAAAGARVRAYEVDPKLEPVLDEVLAGLDVELRFEDAARAVLDLGEERWLVVANLPYHVGTGIVLDLLRSAAGVERVVVMVQREVAERLAAEPGGGDYGVPSVVVGLYALVEQDFRVSPSVFHPPPPVESAVIALRRLAPPDADRELAIELAQAAFGQRRKMLRSSLAEALADPAGALAAAGIEPTFRAEQVGPEDFLALARVSDDR